MEFVASIATNSPDQKKHGFIPYLPVSFQFLFEKLPLTILSLNKIGLSTQHNIVLLIVHDHSSFTRMIQEFFCEKLHLTKLRYKAYVILGYQ
jgi:hypothetical protein